jgi:hypothetical protein
VECFIIGGGPSCTHDQIDRVVHWAKEEGRAVFAVNMSAFLVPSADYAFSRDTQFISKYLDKLERLEAQVIVGNGCITPPWARRIDTTAYISGAACIEAAARLGYTTIYLIGADGHIQGRAHWHEDYKDLKNVPNWEKFDEYYADAIANCAGIEVYNCSPGTAIESVPIIDFEEICPREADK